MKKYLIFFGWKTYPEGGMNDFIDDSNNLQEAKRILMNSITKEIEEYFSDYTPKEKEEVRNSKFWCHIYNTETKEIVYKK